MRYVIGLAMLVLVLGGCDKDKPHHDNPFGPASNQPIQPPPASAIPKPKGPPAFSIDDLSAKVGFSRDLLDKRDGVASLTKDLTDNRQYIDGKDVDLTVDRRAKLPWVVKYVQALSKLAASSVHIKTQTRKSYPGTLVFTPLSKLKSPAKCSVVAMIMKDRSTAVWKLSGGVAHRRGKGMAGPDLTMTGDTIERFGKACKASSTLFVSADDSVEWGLVYDLAASAKTLKKPGFDHFVLLEKTPVPGHPVELQ